MDATFTSPPEVNRIQVPALAAGVVLLVICALAAMFSADGVTFFFRSYLYAFVFWTGVAVGCLGLLMLQYLTGGGWGMVIRRILEAGTRTLPLMLILAIPVALGMSRIYEWYREGVHPAPGATPDVAHFKQVYLTPTFFLVRGLIYFTIWLVIMFLLNKWSADQVHGPRWSSASLAEKLSGPGLVIFFLTVTFAAIDWVMSLDPEWYSTIFGLIFAIAWAISGFTLTIIVLTLLSTRQPMEGVARPSHFHDLGNLLLAFVMLWAYFCFSQFLIIWSGNIPEETEWFLHRLRGGWGWVGLAVVLLHFALPFVLLLQRPLKKNARRLVMIAGLVFLMRMIDLFWFIVAEFHRGRMDVSAVEVAMYVTALLGMGGVWIAYFAWQLARRPLLPVHDPYYKDTMLGAEHHLF